jgi:uncharacterized protein
MSRILRVATSRGRVSAVHTGYEGDPIVLLGHGENNNMHSEVLAGFAEELQDKGLACMRFNFPFMEQKRPSPDPERILRDAYAHAFVRARKLGHPIWVGGKSLGGRIASQLVAEGMPADGVVFLGYPLHPPGKPGPGRVEHLDRIQVPMLFLQGTADPFARWDLIEETVTRLGDRARLVRIEGGDHSFRRRGRLMEDREIGRRLAQTAAGFILHHVHHEQA